jgi:glycosyltransferase involved in cell wall biosynthesis
LQRQACDLGLADTVCFRGDVDHGALPDVYRAASAFVLSSVHEAQGMVALEAAACGLPIVGTRVGVIPELAADDAVAPPGDADALANAIGVTLADSEPRARCALESARTEFSLETCTNRFRDLYAGLVDAQ